MFVLDLLRTVYIATNFFNSTMYPKKISLLYLYLCIMLHTSAKLQIFHMYNMLFRSQCPERRMNG